MSLLAIYASKSLERTLPLGASEHDTYVMLESAYLDNHSGDLCDATTTWEADGEHRGEKTVSQQRAQMLQDVRALRYLLGATDEPLTLEKVLRTHAILLAGAVDASGAPVRNGEVRSGDAHAGTHQYPEGGPHLHEGVQKIIDAYNSTRAAATPLSAEEVVVIPGRLFYDVITLHPFQNGNGRLCRLLLMYALNKAGVPFPVPLSTGHRKARKHYIKAILSARRGNMAELHTMLLGSIEYVLANFQENIRVAPSWQPGTS